MVNFGPDIWARAKTFKWKSKCASVNSDEEDNEKDDGVRGREGGDWKIEFENGTVFIGKGKPPKVWIPAETETQKDLWRILGVSIFEADC